MKICFLDIDGVLNSTEDWIEWKTIGHSVNYSMEMLSRAKMAMLVHIVKTTGCKIVLSSTWRLYYSNEEMISHFEKRGVFFFNEDNFIDQTRDLHNKIRGDEIQEWLDRHPEVTKYIILDDSSDFHDYQKEFHVKTDTYTGMSYYDMKECIKRLHTEDLSALVVAEDELFNPHVTPRTE